MGRQHGRPEADYFDLFPFISILVCTLGCLLMVTMSVVALSLGPGATEIWQIEGAANKLPTLIEWDGDIITIHPGRVRVAFGAASDNGGRNDSPFGRLVERIRQNRGREYIFVAVRPSGFGNLEALLTLLQRQGINAGYEPIEQDRSVGVAEGR